MGVYRPQASRVVYAVPTQSLTTGMYNHLRGQRSRALVDKEEAGMPLTDAQIKRLKPRDARYAVSDGRGLALEVMPTGVASWRYRYQFKGKTERCR